MRTFKINGHTVRAGKGWGISGKMNTRTTLSFNVVDMNGLDHIDNGDTVEITNDGTRIFEGIIKDIEVFEPGPGYLEYNIKVEDYSALADKRVIAKVYEDKTAGYIARDLIAEKLIEEGVTEGVIDDGPTIRKAVFNYIKVSDALNYLRTITGFVWEVDMDRKLNLFNRASRRAPYTLTPAVPHKGFRLTSTMSKYRNTQYIRGGKARTATQENERPSPRPDGESRSFILRYPVAQRPIIEINLGGAGWVAIPETDIGVNGIDRDKKWYFTFDSQILTQDESQTALTQSDAIRVTYTGLRNLFVRIDNPNEIAHRQSAEAGTSGVYEELGIEKSINDIAQAMQYAEGLLETYGQVKDIITFSTEVAGIQPGQLLTIDKPLYGLTGEFLVESVSVRPIGQSMEYSVKALDGAAVGGWEEFFKNLVRGQKDFVIAENEVIITIQSQVERTEYEGNYQMTIVQDLYPAVDLLPSDGLYPGTITGGVSVND